MRTARPVETPEAVFAEAGEDGFGRLHGGVDVEALQACAQLVTEGRGCLEVARGEQTGRGTVVLLETVPRPGAPRTMRRNRRRGN